MSETTSVAIIDDEECIRRALSRLIASAGHAVSTFASAREFLDDPARSRFSCVVADLRMPGIDGLQLQEILHDELPLTSIVFVTGHSDVCASVSALKGGAVDFLEKPVKAERLLEAIARATDHSRELQAICRELHDLKRRYEYLTPREREVFGLVTVGLLNKQIAAELGTAEKTIKQHRARVMAKMNAESLADLVRMADRLGVIPTDTDFSWAKGLRYSAA